VDFEKSPDHPAQKPVAAQRFPDHNRMSEGKSTRGTNLNHKKVGGVKRNSSKNICPTGK
jgi:hypothetical protein